MMSIERSDEIMEWHLLRIFYIQCLNEYWKDPDLLIISEGKNDGIENIEAL